MKGIHVLWSKPSLDNNDNIVLKNYEIITMILSALLWKKHNKNIDLYLDSPAKKILEKYNFFDIYDNINTEILDNIPEEINPKKYYDIPRIFVYNQMKEPFCNIHIGMFHREKFNLKKHKSYYYNREYNLFVSYPHPELFLDENELKDFEYDWSCEYSVNDSFLYIKDLDIVKEYYEKAIPFLINPKNQKYDYFDVYDIRLFFIKFRLLGEILNKKGLMDNRYINDVYLPFNTGISSYGIWQQPNDSESNVYDINRTIQTNFMKKTKYLIQNNELVNDMLTIMSEIKELSQKHYESARDVMRELDDWYYNRIPFLQEDFDIKKYM